MGLPAVVEYPGCRTPRSPAPGRVQVTGHKPVPEPHVNAVRVRLDTCGGHPEPLTACLLTGLDDAPVFVRSDGR